jgi:hypothetical protein
MLTACKIADGGTDFSARIRKPVSALAKEIDPSQVDQLVAAIVLHSVA